MSDLSADLAFSLGGDLQKSLATIRTAIRFRGDFRNVIRFPDASVDVEIQAAFAEFWEFVADQHEGYWDTEFTTITTVGQAYIALASDVWRVHGIDLREGTDWCPLRRIAPGERNRYGTQNGQPEAYRLTAIGAALFPPPNAVYTMRVSYTPRAPLLADGAREFYNGWEEYIIYATLVRLALNERRDAAEWMQQLVFQKERITRGASGRSETEPERIPLHDGPWIDPEMMWRRF